MQIIIVGCGNVGGTLVRLLLAEGHSITVIDTEEDVIAGVEGSLDCMGVVGNGASFQVQREAGIEHADLLIAVTSSDERNLLCCLIAKKAGNCHTIARVRDPIYKREIGYIKEELGLSMVINPEEAAANEAARLLKFPSASAIETFAKGRAELVRMKLGADSALAGRALMELPGDLLSRVLVGIVQRGDEVFIPNGRSVLQEGDEVCFIGAQKSMLRFFKRLGLPTTRVKSAFIIGCGDTGYYLAEQLLTMGIGVKVFEKDRERCEELSDLLPDALIINGDGTEKELLLEEGLTNAEAFVALTNLDEENIMLSMYAKSVSNAKRITRVHRVSYDEIIGAMDLGSILYPRNITANRIMRYVRGMAGAGEGLESLYRIADGRVEVAEFRVQDDTAVRGKKLMEMKLKPGVLIACIIRGTEIIIPGGRDEIRLHDSVILVTTVSIRGIGDMMA
ncbi:MAG: Trk system potassium transporter TrkA [Lachnospiraceae bacterium]|nr:Trk system potassium transporter TrkA [Lachnospiraceae bacterium]